MTQSQTNDRPALRALKARNAMAILRFIARENGKGNYPCHGVSILSDILSISPERVKTWLEFGIEKKYSNQIVAYLNSLSGIRWGKYQVCPGPTLL